MPLTFLAQIVPSLVLAIHKKRNYISASQINLTLNRNHQREAELKLMHNKKSTKLSTLTKISKLLTYLKTF